MKVLIVVDMQNDFILGGSLGTPESKEIIPNVFSKIEEYRYGGNFKEALDDNEDTIFGLDSDDANIVFTQDTHYKNKYGESEEGKHLPVLHCIKGTTGWDLIPEFDYFKKYGKIFNTIRKETFGSDELVLYLQGLDDKYNIESVELIGVCTDICVISNAIIAKTTLPNVPIYVDASCCAGTTPEAHDKAIDLMENSLQINILNKGDELWRK